MILEITFYYRYFKLSVDEQLKIERCKGKCEKYRNETIKNK